jgi:hypothetical protein
MYIATTPISNVKFAFQRDFVSKKFILLFQQHLYLLSMCGIVVDYTFHVVQLLHENID